MSSDTASQGFIDVVAVAAIPPGRGLPVRVAGRSVALFKIGEAVHAIENTCPHQGSALAGGRLSGCIVRCPSHGLPFDVRDGCMPGNSALRVNVYAARVIDGRVGISIPESHPGETATP
jgi:3-phenylpropionate/trans-cinnamate dioxygenase ferredoxin subunit